MFGKGAGSNSIQYISCIGWMDKRFFGVGSHLRTVCDIFRCGTRVRGNHGSLNVAFLTHVVFVYSDKVKGCEKCNGTC